MKEKVLVTDKVHDVLISGLEAINYQVIYDPAFDPGSLKEQIGNYTGIVINSKIRMTAEMMDAAPDLKFIARLGSGMEIIDVDYAQKKGIRVFNSPEGNCNAVGEHALGMLLALLNNIVRSDAELREKTWRREANRGRELSGKTIGVIGLGHTGRAFVSKLSGWTLDIVYCDPYVLNSPPEFDYIRKVSLDDICQLSDVISLHVPLTEETYHMVNASFAERCIKKPVLINTSRGAVVNTADLITALKEGLFSGACLDVFENEKPHRFTKEEDQLFRELYGLPNVVLTPHIAGWTEESLFGIAKVLLDKISEAFA